MPDSTGLAMVLEQLSQRLARIENMLDRISTSHDLFEEKLNARVAVLELKLAKQEGGKAALAGLMTAAAAVGGIFVSFIGPFFQGFFGPR